MQIFKVKVESLENLQGVGRLSGSERLVAYKGAWSKNKIHVLRMTTARFLTLAKESCKLLEG